MLLYGRDVRPWCGSQHTELLEEPVCDEWQVVMNKRKLWQRLECIVYTFVVAVIAFEIVFSIRKIFG